MKSTMVFNVFATLDLQEMLQDNVYEKILCPAVVLMNNTITSSNFAYVNKITTESMINAKFLLHVEQIPSGMVLDVSAILDLFPLTVNALLI